MPRRQRREFLRFLNTIDGVTVDRKLAPERSRRRRPTSIIYE
jgi:hypothetical protein